MWLCSDGPVAAKGYDRIGTQCNNAGKFYLAGTLIHTRLGKPNAAAWTSAASYMNAQGHDFICAGQPARSCSWSDWSNGFACNGLGYVHTNDAITSGNWLALTDGNGAERRNWPSANSPSSGHRMPSLCVYAAHIPGAYVWGKYIWRL